jgi:hypothetical protein
MRRGFLAVLCLLLFTPLLCWAQHDVTRNSAICYFSSPSGPQSNVLLESPRGRRAPRPWKDLPPDFFVELIPEFRMPETPQQPPAMEFKAAPDSHCLPEVPSSALEGNEPDAKDDTPLLVPKWRIYPFFMNPPAEVPSRGECDVYLPLGKDSVWRCPPPPAVIRRTRL